MLKKSRGGSAFALVILAAALLIGFGEFSSAGALSGVYLCLNDLLPSLFPFMILSALTVNSGASRIFGRIFGGFFRLLFGFSDETSSAILLGMIGGYPVGASGIAVLYKKGLISEREAASASLVAVGSGAGFLISFVGVGLYGDIRVGFILYAAQISSVIIIGILNKLIFVRKKFNSDKEIKYIKTPFTIALIDSVTSGTYRALEMCGIVILFSAVIGIVERFAGVYSVYFETALEVTNACADLALSRNLLLTAFAIGFGGLCVHCQIFAVLREIKIKKGLFFLYRIIQGIITTLITYALICAFGISTPVFSSVASTVPSLSASIFGSGALIASSLCFLYCIKGHRY